MQGTKGRKTNLPSHQMLLAAERAVQFRASNNYQGKAATSCVAACRASLCNSQYQQCSKDTQTCTARAENKDRKKERKKTMSSYVEHSQSPEKNAIHLLFIVWFVVGSLLLCSPCGRHLLLQQHLLLLLDQLLLLRIELRL